MRISPNWTNRANELGDGLVKRPDPVKQNKVGGLVKTSGSYKPKSTYLLKQYSLP